MGRSFSVGDVVGGNNSMLVLSFIKKHSEGNRQPLYEVECQICKLDSELFGDAKYKATSDYLKANKLPCGCSSAPKWSKEQWEVLIKRKASSKDITFNGFVCNDKIGQNSKLNLECNVCGNVWDSCSINNFIKDRGCPCCANRTRAIKKNTSDEEWVSRFRQTELFPQDIFKFKRVSEFSRSWEVTCKVCGDDNIFISDRSNLVAGKVPCNCSIGGGFDVSKTGYFYILYCKIEDNTFIKYGITNFLHRRLTGHKRTLLDSGGVLLSSTAFTATGHEVLQLESHLKRTIKPLSDVGCFKKETCSILELAVILKELGDTKLQLVD